MWQKRPIVEVKETYFDDIPVPRKLPSSHRPTTVACVAVVRLVAPGERGGVSERCVRVCVCVCVCVCLHVKRCLV